MNKQTHVIKHDNGWGFKQSGSQRVSRHFDTKAEAVSAARITSHNLGTELVIHDKNGRIQNCDSHGNDPCPPRDKK